MRLNKIVISKILFCTTFALTLMASCGLNKEPEPRKTPEEIRLEEVSRMDTVELMMRVNPDTIEGRTKHSDIGKERLLQAIYGVDNKDDDVLAGA